jgi:DNA excision repair protein ERCC-4
MLPFYTAMMEQLLEHDGLTVLGEGLGLHKLLAAFVRLHAAQGGGLVLLLGCQDWQKRVLLQELAAADEGATPPPADVTAEMSIAERLASYAAGGCLFVTTRILVVDLLTARLPPSAVSGERAQRATALQALACPNNSARRTLQACWWPTRTA